jgi:outer membrane lipoprotein-sorting protein
MKPALRLLLCLLLSAIALGLYGEEDYASFLRQVDEKMNFLSGDFAAQYDIKQDKPGEGSSLTTAALFRRDRKAQFLVLILEPEEDKGKGYLVVDGGIWFYDPKDRRYTFKDAKEAFRGTNARNSDFALSNLAGQYKVTGESSEKLGIYPCTRLELEATTTDASFPKRSIWVSEDKLLRMSRDYGQSGQLFRTVAYQYQVFQGKSVPSKVVILDELKTKIIQGATKKETTTLTISKPSFQDLPSTMFTKDYLERMSK